MEDEQVHLDRPRRRWLLVAVGCSAFAVIATACTPPATPATPTTTAPALSPTTTSTTTSTTTTTTTAPANPCPTTTSVLQSDAPPNAAVDQRYAAVVRDPATQQTRVLVSQATNAQEVAQFRAEAAATGDVIAFSQDGEVHALGQSESWGFTDSGFRTTWVVAPASTGASVRVAVIDTGVDAGHPDLTAAVGSDPYPGMDFVNLCTDSSNQQVPTPGVRTDPNGHGTHVSGIIAAADDSQGVVGAAPGVTIVPVRVLDASGSGTYSDVAAGILWAADKTGGNASVLSMSLGGGTDSSVVKSAITTVMTDPAYTHPVIVIAAGNNGNATNPTYPAIYANTFSQVLSVAALCKPGFLLSPRTSDECTSDSTTIAKFSSRAWDGTGTATGVSAPGTSILSDWPGGATMVESGTSMATPLVAALAALVASRCPADTATQVVGRLESTATDLGAPGVDMQYGYGGIDPAAAVAAC